MRPLISWSALTSASVGLWGLGVEGGASLRRLGSMGLTPVLVDDNPAVATLGDLEILATDHGGLEALLACDVVIKSPGISRYRPEVARLEGMGIPVRSGLGLWLEDVPLDRVTCITGTKGKSTTTAIAGHLLSHLGGGQHRASPVGSHHRTGAGLLGRRDLELSGARPDQWSPRRRRDLTVPGPPGLARVR